MDHARQSLLFASLGPPMFGINRAKFSPHWMALATAIFRCSPKLSPRTSCTPRYLMLVFHSTSCSPKTILGYWEDLLSITSKASVFSGTIFRPLLSNQRFARHRFLLRAYQGCGIFPKIRNNKSLIKFVCHLKRPQPEHLDKTADAAHYCLGRRL